MEVILNVTLSTATLLLLTCSSMPVSAAEFCGMEVVLADPSLNASSSGNPARLDDGSLAIVHLPSVPSVLPDGFISWRGEAVRVVHAASQPKPRDDLIVTRAPESRDPGLVFWTNPERRIASNAPVVIATGSDQGKSCDHFRGTALSK